MMKPIELQKKLKTGGVSFMVVTPFNENEEIDYAGLRENVRFLLEKIKGFDTCTITPAGSNGEFPHLSEEEQKQVIKTCVEEVGGKATVIAGTGRASTYSTINISKYAQEVGADGVQVILPYYFVPMEEGMYAHYKQLAESIDIGMVIYNNPAFSGSWIKPKLMSKMIQDFGGDGKIAGVKENTPHLMLFNAMAKTLKGTGVALHSGFGEEWYAYQFPWGADGMATPFGNFYPEFPMAMYNASKNYDFDTMRSLLAGMEPYYSFVGRCSAARTDTGILTKPGGSIYGEGNLRFGIIKAAMNLMGLSGGKMRTPLTGITEKETDELKEIMKALKII